MRGVRRGRLRGSKEEKQKREGNSLVGAPRKKTGGGSFLKKKKNRETFREAPLFQKKKKRTKNRGCERERKGRLVGE